MAENTITSSFVALCLVCLWITATQLLNFLTESSQCYREATRVEDNDCATLKDCIHRAKFVVEDAKVSSYKALRLILLSAVFSVAGMQEGGYWLLCGGTSDGKACIGTRFVSVSKETGKLKSHAIFSTETEKLFADARNIDERLLRREKE